MSDSYLETLRGALGRMSSLHVDAAGDEVYVSKSEILLEIDRLTSVSSEAQEGGEALPEPAMGEGRDPAAWLRLLGKTSEPSLAIHYAINAVECRRDSARYRTTHYTGHALALLTRAGWSLRPPASVVPEGEREGLAKFVSETFDVALAASHDPGRFTPRADEGGDPEPLHRWQRRERALAETQQVERLKALLSPPPAASSSRPEGER